MVCEESQSEIILAAVDINGGAAGTTSTNDTNTKGAEKFYILREIQPVSFTSPSQSTIAGTVSSGASAVDQNVDSKSSLTDNSGVTDPVQRFDFGSIATRRVACIYGRSASSSGTHILKFRTSTDASTWTGYTTVFSTSSTPAIAATLLLASSTISMRYVEFTYANSSGDNVSAYLYEVWDSEEGGYGTFATKFEIYDTARSSWKTMSDVSFTTLASLGTTSDITTGGIIPYAASGLFRVSYTTIGHINPSITMVKVKPCTT